MNEGSAERSRSVQRGELGSAKCRFLFHEVFLNQITVLDERLIKRKTHYALCNTIGLGVYETIIGENEVGSVVLHSLCLGTLDENLFVSNWSSGNELRKANLFEIGKPPLFVCARRVRSDKECPPTILLMLDIPIRKLLI